MAYFRAVLVVTKGFMIPDCIDPESGHVIREIMEMSHSQQDPFDFYDYFHDFWRLRIHWSSCPACRMRFADAPILFAEVAGRLEDGWRVALSELKDDFLRSKQAQLAAVNDSADQDFRASSNTAIGYNELIAQLALAGDDANALLYHAQEALSFRIRPEQEPEDEYRSPLEPFLSFCREFIFSLEPEFQHFLCTARIAYEMFREETDVQAALANSKARAEVLFRTIEMAATAYVNRLNETSAIFIDETNSAQRRLTAPESAALRNAVQEVNREWKQEFNDFRDSMKATQMELLRQIEVNRRQAANYEPFIISQLSVPLYSRLHETTQRALQVAEYFYSINYEPDGFGGNALATVQLYENELMVRIIGPFITELLATGTQTYEVQGSLRGPLPLINHGKVQERSLTLGNLVAYLSRDRGLQNKLSALGFHVEGIAKDASWINERRNRVAHRFGYDRAGADELRRRILCRDGALSRLHPAMPISAAEAPKS